VHDSLLRETGIVLTLLHYRRRMTQCRCRYVYDIVGHDLAEMFENTAMGTRKRLLATE